MLLSRYSGRCRMYQRKEDSNVKRVSRIRGPLERGAAWMGWRDVTHSAGAGEQ